MDVFTLFYEAWSLIALGTVEHHDLSWTMYRTVDMVDDMVSWSVGGNY